MKGGQASQSIVEFVDVYPTVADFCGLKAPHTLAGVSLKQILESPAATVEVAAFTLVTRAAKLHGKSVRTERWRFTLWSDGISELYDHRSDPEGLHNVAAKHADVVEDLAAKIHALPPFNP